MPLDVNGSSSSGGDSTIGAKSADSVVLCAAWSTEHKPIGMIFDIGKHEACAETVESADFALSAETDVEARLERCSDFCATMLGVGVTLVHLSYFRWH